MDTEFITYEQQLNDIGYCCTTNSGVSMLPLLREGKDVMVIEKKDTFCVYDAVLFMRPGIKGRGRYVLHRILKDNGNGTYWIVGDNCTGGETVKRENILGVLTAVKRNGKTVKVTDRAYRIYVRLWCAPYKFRFFILRCLRFAKSICRFTVRKIFRIRKK